MPTQKLRIQDTVDAELRPALEGVEPGGNHSRSRLVRDLALKGAPATREEGDARRRAVEHLLRVTGGEDDRYDFAVSESLHAER